MGRVGALPAGPRGLPLLGNIVQLEHDALGFLMAVQRRYGRMATIRFGQTPVVVLFDPEHIRHVLAERPEIFANGDVAGGLAYGKLLRLSLLMKGLANQAANRLRDLVGDDGLIMGDGDHHDRLRHLIQPAFSRRGIAPSTAMITQYAEDLVSSWHAGQELEIVGEIRRLTLRVILTILVGSEFANESHGGPEIMEAMLRNPANLLEAMLQQLPIDLPFTPYGRRMNVKRRGDRALYGLIDRRAAEGRKAGDVLSVLLSSEDGEQRRLSREQVRDAIVSLIAAGHETTTNTLAWTIYLLSCHPEVFERVRSELAAVLGGRSPVLDDLPRLVYLNQVIRESMRLYPAGWVMGRISRGDFSLDGYHLPPGTRLMLTQWVTHRHPDLWEEPDAFRPERWDPATPTKRPEWAYFPFGLGRRICPGKSLSELETLLVLPVLLQRFFPRVIAGQAVEPLPLITLRPKLGILVRLEPVATDQKLPAGQSGSPTPSRCPYPHESQAGSERQPAGALQ